MATVRAPERPTAAARHAQSRARYPELTGVAERAGGRIAWEAYGQGDPPIVFVPPWQIVHSRVWKAQIPDFARRHRVIAWDNRGNGRSDRPSDPMAHTSIERAANLEAVLDAAGVNQAVLVGLSGASGPMLIFTAEHPERVLGLVFICPATPFGEPSAGSDVPFEEPLDTDHGWSKENIHFWRRDYAAYLEFFFAEAVPEPHSTKQREDGVSWGLDTDPDSLAATIRAPRTIDLPKLRVICASIRCPVLVIQGSNDRIGHVTQGTGLAEAIPGAREILIEGAGHVAVARHPVRINLAIRDFLSQVHRADHAIADD